jgi:pectin methylesterase-like acyl-CoA thioesterase
MESTPRELFMSSQKPACLLLLTAVALSLSLGPVLAQGAPPKLVVSPTNPEAYRTIQNAIDHAPESGATILIAPGTYREKVLIKTPGIRLVGTGTSSSNVVLTFDDSAKTTGSTFRSGTVTVLADRFEAENLSIVNTWWDEHPNPADYSQAVALHLVGDRAVLDRVRLISGQDTLFAASNTCRSSDITLPCHASRQFFNDSFIEGNVDYIFGDARAVFNGCELHSRQYPHVAITAQSRNSTSSDSGYYFLHCSITGREEGDSVVFGRPWRTYAKVMFYDTDVRQTLAPEGWSEWEGRLRTADYREYLSHGPGVNPNHRAVAYPPLSLAEQATLTPAGLLAEEDQWNPEKEIALLRQLAR